MKKTSRSFLFAATASLALINGPLAHAADTQDRIVDALNQQGFAVRKVKKTWLGRVRIEAAGGGLVREVVFNPSTGEILRDFWEPEDRDDGPAIVLANPNRKRTSTEATDDDNRSGSPQASSTSNDDDDEHEETSNDSESSDEDYESNDGHESNDDDHDEESEESNDNGDHDEGVEHD